MSECCVIDGDEVRPCLVLRAGRWYSRVAVFRPFRGIEVKRVWNRRLLSDDESERYAAFEESIRPKKGKK